MMSIAFYRDRPLLTVLVVSRTQFYTPWHTLRQQQCFFYKWLKAIVAADLPPHIDKNSYMSKIPDHSGHRLKKFVCAIAQLHYHSIQMNFNTLHKALKDTPTYPLFLSIYIWPASSDPDKSRITSVCHICNKCANPENPSLRTPIRTRSRPNSSTSVLRVCSFECL